MRHYFHPEAALEFEEAIRFYQSRGGRLAARLNAEVRAAIERISEAPEQWSVLEEDVRRCFVRVFPYRVLYTIEPKFVLIIAIAHNKRAPGYWKHRLSFRASGGLEA